LFTKYEGVVGIIGFFYLPESPRWLLTQGRVEEAEKVLEQIAVYNGTDIGPVRLSRKAVLLVECGNCFPLLFHLIL